MFSVTLWSFYHQIQSLEEKCKVLEDKCSALTAEMNSSISQITQLKKLLSEYEENVKTSENSATDLVIVQKVLLNGMRVSNEQIRPWLKMIAAQFWFWIDFGWSMNANPCLVWTSSVEFLGVYMHIGIYTSSLEFSGFFWDIVNARFR